MKRKKYTNTNEKIKCNIKIGKRIPDSTYSITFKVDSNVLLNKTKSYISKFLDSNERLQLDDFFKKETDNIISIITEYADICTSSVFPTELEQIELFQNACKQSLKYRYTNREKREKETRRMLQNEGIENYIKRAKEEGLIDDNIIQQQFNRWNNMFDEEARSFLTYLDIYSEVETKRKCYLCYLPEIYKKAIIDKIGNNLEDYIFSKVKENLKMVVADLFFKYLENLNKEKE